MQKTLNFWTLMHSDFGLMHHFVACTYDVSMFSFLVILFFKIDTGTLKYLF